MSDLNELLQRLARFSHDAVEFLVLLPFHLIGLAHILVGCACFAAVGGLVASQAVSLLFDSPLAAAAAGVLWAVALFVMLLLRALYARYGAGEE